MNYAWVNELIGTPWVGRGPEKFDCWDLIRTVHYLLFDRVLPEFAVDAENIRQVLRAIRNHPYRMLWEETDDREDGVLVKFFRASDPDHMGVWLNADGGGVLHNQRGNGVVFDSLLALKAAGWGSIRFYRYAGND